MDQADVLDKLISAAQKAGNWLDDVASRQRLMNELNEPEWEKRSRTHDWRNYISNDLIDVWDELPTLARLAAFIGAELQAQREVWE